MYPRDAAGSFTLPPGTVGNITGLCSLDDFLEIYTPSETFKVRSPESIDPARTNPNAMWAMVRTHFVGSSSPIVARTLLMASRSANLLSPIGGEHPLIVRMHGIKESLLEVQAAASALTEAIAGEAAALEASGFRLAPNGRTLEHFSHVPDLKAKVSLLLTTARRVISEICQIPNHFLVLGRQHSSVESLVEKELASKLSKQGHNYMLDFVPGTKHLIELRNGLEHGATSARKLFIQNFEHAPDNSVRRPALFLDGDDPEDIVHHAANIPDFLLELAESMFVACADAAPRQWPVQFESIETVDSECPVRYQVVMDPARFKFPESSAT